MQLDMEIPIEPFDKNCNPGFRPTDDKTQSPVLRGLFSRSGGRLAEPVYIDTHNSQT